MQLALFDASTCGARAWGATRCMKLTRCRCAASACGPHARARRALCIVLLSVAACCAALGRQPAAYDALAPWRPLPCPSCHHAKQGHGHSCLALPVPDVDTTTLLAVHPAGGQSGLSPRHVLFASFLAFTYTCTAPSRAHPPPPLPRAVFGPHGTSPRAHLTTECQAAALNTPQP